MPDSVDSSFSFPLSLSLSRSQSQPQSQSQSLSMASYPPPPMYVCVHFLAGRSGHMFLTRRSILPIGKPMPEIVCPMAMAMQCTYIHVHTHVHRNSAYPNSVLYVHTHTTPALLCSFSVVFFLYGQQQQHPANSALR